MWASPSGLMSRPLMRTVWPAGATQTWCSAPANVWLTALSRRDFANSPVFAAFPSSSHQPWTVSSERPVWTDVAYSQTVFRSLEGSACGSASSKQPIASTTPTCSALPRHCGGGPPLASGT